MKNTISSNDHNNINKPDFISSTEKIKAEQMIKKYGPQFP